MRKYFDLNMKSILDLDSRKRIKLNYKSFMAFLKIYPESQSFENKISKDPSAIVIGGR